MRIRFFAKYLLLFGVLLFGSCATIELATPKTDERDLATLQTPPARWLVVVESVPLTEAFLISLKNYLAQWIPQDVSKGITVGTLNVRNSDATALSKKIQEFRPHAILTITAKDLKVKTIKVPLRPIEEDLRGGIFSCRLSDAKGQANFWSSELTVKSLSKSETVEVSKAGALSIIESLKAIGLQKK